MGSGIAQKIAQEGMQVVLVDIKQTAVDNGIAGIRGLLQGGVKRGLSLRKSGRDPVPHHRYHGHGGCGRCGYRH